MQILQLVPGLWQSLSSFVSTLEMLSMPFLLMFASCLITISTFLCKILRLLMSFCAALLRKVKRKLSKQQQPQPKAEHRLRQLEQELQSLRETFKSSEVKENEQQRIFKIQR